MLHPRSEALADRVKHARGNASAKRVVRDGNKLIVIASGGRGEQCVEATLSLWCLLGSQVVLVRCELPVA